MADADVERAIAALAGGRRPIYWERLSSPKVAALVEAGMKLALLPVGAIEQHGPHLPLNTDSSIAEAVAALASAQTGVPVLPTISYASSIGHTSYWPGTLSLYPETLILTCKEIGRWLVDSAFTRLIFVNAHFGNDASLRVAVDRLRTDFLGRLSVATRNTWELCPEAKAFYLADGEDIHANRAETSLMLAIAPESVGDYRRADDPDRTDGLVFSYPVALTSLNGVTGRPSEANADEGRRMLRTMGDALAGLVGRALAEAPPIDPKRTREHG